MTRRSTRPCPSTETFVEASYQYQAAKWWQIQPDIQYIFNPGAGIATRTIQHRRSKTNW